MANQDQQVPTTMGAPRGLFPAGAVEMFHSRDFDEMASLPPLWEQHYSQIRRGQYVGGLFMAMTADLIVSLESSSVGLMIRGCIPPDSAIIAIPFGCGGRSTYRGERLCDRSAVIVFSGEELDFRSTTAFDVCTLVAKRSVLEQHAQRVLGRSLESLRRNAQGMISDPAGLEGRIRALIDDLAAQRGRLGAQLMDPVLAAVFERDVCDEILSGLMPREAAGRKSDRAKLAWRVEEYLRRHVGQEVAIRDLCRHTGAAERTLHLAFREEVGSTPKAYLKVLLLNAARRDLRVARAGTTVTEVAMRWGFLHLGWFAHDYKGMFGESPNETLLGRGALLHSLRRPSLDIPLRAGDSGPGGVIAVSG